MNLHIDSPGITVALALAVGLTAQALGRHLRIPGIVLLLGAGALLGADGLGVLHPEVLGEGLEILVGYAVAVILFEGGLNLNVAQLRQQAVVIRRLITSGAVITTVGGTLLARFVMGWSWPMALVFGSLVMVTGPTVITPLLRRTRVKHELHTILEAEGVFIDAVGALTAVAAFDLALQWTGSNALESLLDFGIRFGGGCVIGLIGGAIMVVLVRYDSLVPRGLENVFILSLALVLFQVSNELMPESGIAAAAVAGILVGNTKTRVTRELREFKEQLTVMLIGMLFVLLAAEVRLDDVLALGTSGVLTVLGLMVIVRPLDVAFSARGTELTVRDKAFLSWLAPRGIVAAAVSSLFARQFAAAGVAGGEELRALVFLVIAMTVLVQGLLAGPVAQLLGVRRPHQGYVIVGANGLGLALGRILRDTGHEVVFIDNNASATGHAEEAGFRALWGSALDAGVLRRAELEARAGAVATTTSEEVNGMFALMALADFRVPSAQAGMQRGRQSFKAETLREGGAAILYGDQVDLDRWALRLQRGRATTEPWVLGDAAAAEWRPPEGLEDAVLPLAVRTRAGVVPFDDTTTLKAGREMWLAINEAHRDEVCAWLESSGWSPATEQVATPSA